MSVAVREVRIIMEDGRTYWIDVRPEDQTAAASVHWPDQAPVAWIRRAAWSALGRYRLEIECWLPFEEFDELCAEVRMLS